MSLLDSKVLLLDLQTTGAKPPRANILEIAWCVAAAGDADHRIVQSHLIQQKDDIPFRIQMITGIEDEEMVSAVPLSEPTKALESEIRSLGDNPIAVIHFAQFEQPFLHAYLADCFSGVKIVCTHQIAARLFPNLPSRGIRGLAGFFGNTLLECKRASNHVSATFLIWRSLCRELKMRGVETVEQLHEWLQDVQPAKRTKYEYPLDTKLRLGLPDAPGVYRMISKAGEVLYVGKATSLNARVNSYFRGQKGRDPRKLEMLTQAWNLDVTVCHSALEACLLEVDEIKRLSPPYNIALKVLDRQLVFCSRDFTSASTAPDNLHVVGPFRSTQVIAPLMMVADGARTGEFSQEIFFDAVPAELLSEGFSIFLERHGLSGEPVQDARSLLVLGMIRYRAYLHWLAQQKEVAEETAGDSTIGDELDDELPAELEQELTADEVASRFERLLFRTARAYLLAKRLTRLLSCRIAFSEGNSARQLYLRGGQVYAQADSSDNGSGNAAHPWIGLGLNVFDRMRVLDTELQRMQGAGMKVTLETDTPLRHNRRSASAFS